MFLGRKVISRLKISEISLYFNLKSRVVEERLFCWNRSGCNKDYSSRSQSFFQESMHDVLAGQEVLGMLALAGKK